MNISTHGDCYCGALIVVIDGVWPDGHGLGKCVHRPPIVAYVDGPTIELCRGCMDRLPTGPCAADCWLLTEDGAEALQRAKRRTP